MSGSAPISLTGIFGPDSDDDHEDIQENTIFCNERDIQRICLAGQEVDICQMSWHQANANQIWPGTYVLADHILQTKNNLADTFSRYENCSILELGAATGALSIALMKAGKYHMISSDIDDGGDVFNNIKENFERNSLPMCQHITHSWGEGWPADIGTIGIKFIVASDILLYVKVYPGLVQTLTEIFDREHNLVEFLMSWKRRIKESTIFFDLMKEAGFECFNHGKCVYSFFRRNRMDDYLRDLYATHPSTLPAEESI